MQLNPASCPNCGQPVTPDAKLCPNCGMVLPAAAWPPAPQGMPPAPQIPVTPTLVTGKAWGDITLGVILSLIACAAGGIGFIVMPILYFTLRRQNPVFARGMGFGLLAGIALVLGIFGLCIYGLSHENG